MRIFELITNARLFRGKPVLSCLRVVRFRNHVVLLCKSWRAYWEAKVAIVHFVSRYWLSWQIAKFLWAPTGTKLRQTVNCIIAFQQFSLVLIKVQQIAVRWWNTKFVTSTVHWLQHRLSMRKLVGSIPVSKFFFFVLYLCRGFMFTIFIQLCVLSSVSFSWLQIIWEDWQWGGKATRGFQKLRSVDMKTTTGGGVYRDRMIHSGYRRHTEGKEEMLWHCAWWRTFCSPRTFKVF